MNYENFKIKFDQYLEKELNENETKEFELHLGSCMSCKKELMGLNKCIRIMNKLYKDEDPPETIRKIVYDRLKQCK